MGRRRENAGLWHRPRGSISERAAPHYFVPSFAIRRAATPDGELVEMLGKLKKELKKEYGKTYRVYQPGQVSMTVIQQGKLVERVREADEHPSIGRMRTLAHTIGDSLLSRIESTKPGLMLPVGRVDSFGDKTQNKLGFTPNGWKGYNARYAAQGIEDETLPLSLIVDEHKIAVGSIAAAFANNKRFVVDGLARTPHVVLAERAGARIPDHELRDVAGIVDEILPNELALDDPVIYFRPYRSAAVETMYVRLAG